jgi:polyisoprenyl-phosphate glycosyltransferase
MHKKPLISLIVPCYNEQESIELAVHEITKFWKKIEHNYDYEIVCVDDGSRDKTSQIIEKLSVKNPNVKLVQFSRNFGKEIATTAGIAYCSGDACIMYDADMQYPIEKIPDFLAKWKLGADVVVGIRDKKKTSNIIEKVGSFAFYKLVNMIAEIQIRSGALDFRLMDRSVINEFNKFTERGRMTRALIDWLGFKRDYVFYTEGPRVAGEASYDFSKRLALAFNTFISTSLLPLKLAGYLGVIITIISGLVGLFTAVNKFVFNDPLGLGITGSTQVGILSVFLTGINLISLGLIALYIANIHTEVANRPLYVVKKTLNYHKPQPVKPTVIHF